MSTEHDTEFLAWREWAEHCAKVRGKALEEWHASYRGRDDKPGSNEGEAHAWLAIEADPECRRLLASWKAAKARAESPSKNVEFVPLGTREEYEQDVREAEAAYAKNRSSKNHLDLLAAKDALRRHFPNTPRTGAEASGGATGSENPCADERTL